MKQLTQRILIGIVEATVAATVATLIALHLTK